MSENILKITSCKSQISKLEGYVSEIKQRFHIQEKQYPDILISLTEAVNNAIIHGNCNDTAKCVDIICAYHSDRLTFTISDEGKGFDPNTIKDPLALENIDLEGGRGVFIMKTLCDNVKYFDEGRTVEMTFKLNSSVQKH